MQTKEFLDKVCEQIKYKPIRNEISEELESHIKESQENYIQEGIEENKAEEKAIIQMGGAEEIGKKLNKIHKPKMNWQLLILVLILLVFGFLVSYIDGTDNWKLNLIYTMLNTIPFLLIYFFDYRKIQKHSYLIYCIATIILLMPIISGDKTYSTRLVTRIIAMPLYIISFVGFIENINKESKIKIEYINTYNISVNIVILVLSIISLIIMLQYSRSLTFILILTYYAIITAKIIQMKEKKYIKKLCKITSISIIILTLIWLGSLVKYNKFDDTIHTIGTIFNPEIDADTDIVWQRTAQIEIIKSAKLFGKANNVDISTEMLFNTEKGIFPLNAILLNYGWIISILMLIMVLSFSIKLIIDTRKIKDTYGKLVIIGIASSFIFRSMLCILINLNPGIPLNSDIPFISYGKINLVIDILSLAVIFSVYRRKNIILNTNKEIA